MRFKIGKEVEGALRAGAEEPQGLKALKKVGARCAMNRRGCFDERSDFGPVGKGGEGAVLDRGGNGAEGLADHGAKGRHERPQGIGHRGEAQAPAPSRKGLRQPGGDDGLGGEHGRHGGRRAAGKGDQAVDLVGEDDHPLPLADLCKALEVLEAVECSGGVSGAI